MIIVVLSDEIKEKIKIEAMDRISFYDPKTGEKVLSKKNNLFRSNQIVVKNQEIEYEPGKKLKLKKDSVMVLIDKAPDCNWGHPCQQVYYDAETGDALKTIDSIYPSLNYQIAPTQYESVYTPVELPETSDSGISEIPALSEAVTNSEGERYAILFSGFSQKRHLNDLEHLYRILIQFYGYKEENIFVLHYNGNLDFVGNDFTGGYWDKWPGGTGYDDDFSIFASTQVNRYLGTKTDLTNVLNIVRERILPNDTLFLHVTGGGYYDPDYYFECYPGGATNLFTASEMLSEFSSFPEFAVLIVMMEQSFSGGFASVFTGLSQVSKVHFSAACGSDGVSRGGSDFNFFAKEWTAAMRGEYPSGSGFERIIDVNIDGRVCGTEAFDYAKIMTQPLEDEFENGFPADIPVSAEKTPGDGESVFLGYPVHDLYIRDYVGDEGVEGPSDQVYSRSPDIIVFNNPLGNPEAVLASPEAMTRNDLGEPVEYGQVNYVYLRVQNRGEFHSVSGRAKVYWADPSALQSPFYWNDIDTNVEIPPINPQAVGIVGPILMENPPRPGHYCFIALIQSGSDPEPDKGQISSRAVFYHYIAENNNAAWRNFNSVNMFEGAQAEIRMSVTGWPSESIRSDLKIDMTEFPPKTETELTILNRLAETASVNHMTLKEENPNNNTYSVIPGKLASLDEMDLKRGERSNARLSITLPPKIKHGYYTVTIQQVVDQKIMGELVHMLAVGDFPFTANKITNEVHKTDCPQVAEMKLVNKVAFEELDRAILRGYNGCIHCLEEFDADAREKQIEIVKKILIEYLYDDPTQIPEEELEKLVKVEEEIVDTLKKAI